MNNTTSREPEKASPMTYPEQNSDPELGQISGGPREPMFKRFVDSFRQDKGATVTPEGVIGADGKVFAPEEGVQYVPELAHKLKTRHLQMIAIGGSIGMLALCSMHFGSGDFAVETGFNLLRSGLVND